MERFFLNPWALALSALAGGIILLYILKLKRVKVRVSSTLLWERTVQDFKANAPWQRLRRNLLMILQVIALLLLAVALARPFMFGTALTGGRTVLVLDTSASMLATDESPDRLGSALNAASGLINDLSRRDEGMVVAAGPQPRLLQSFTTDHGELNRAVREARDNAGGVADLDAALQLISSVAAGSNARVVIFSDGAIPDLDPFAATDLNISYYPVGRESENLALVGAGARRNPFTEEYELFVAVHNYFGTPQQVDVTLNVGEELVDVREVELGPGERQELVLANLPYVEEPIRVELDYPDLLDADNLAYIVMPQQVRYAVALCTTGESVLLRKVLESLDEITLFTYTGGALSGPAEASTSDIDVWVVERDAEAGVDPAASYLFIDTTTHAYLPVVAGTKAQMDFTADPPVIPTIVGLDRGHPTLRFVNITGVRLQAMRRCQLQPWARTIVDASEGPLIVQGEQEGQRTLYLAFDLYESDFPLRAAFPIFMANAIQFLGQAASGVTGLSAAAGERVDLIAPLEATQVTITDPTGRQTMVELGTRDFTLSSTEHTGVYALRYLDEAGADVSLQYLPVSLVNEAESNIAPAQTIRVRGVEEALAAGVAEVEIVGSKEVRTNREFYLWLIIAVLLILGVEWYLYHTRAL